MVGAFELFPSQSSFTPVVMPAGGVQVKHCVHEGRVANTKNRTVIRSIDFFMSKMFWSNIDKVNAKKRATSKLIWLS